MATAYTSLLGLALPVTGELSGTWGATVNDEITALLDSAVAGTTSITADADITLSDTDGAANETRQAVILWNPATGTTTRNITAPARSKAYIVINASGGTQSIVLRGAGPTTGVTIVKGEKALCAWDGSDFVKVANQNGIGNFTTVDTTNLEVTNLKALDGTAAGSIANSTGVVTLASSVLTTTDINGGTIDGTAIGGSTAAAGAFTTLSATGVTTVQAGTAAAPAITTTGDTNTGIFFPAADTIAFSEGGVESARIDSAGNMGLGVTPSAWGAGPSLQIGGIGVGSRTSLTSLAQFSANQYWDGAAHRYIATNFATLYTQNAGAHTWSIAPSGTAGNTISFTQAMTLDSSGNVGIGESSPSTYGKFVVSGGSNANAGIFIGNSSLTGSAPTYKGTVRIIDNPQSATGANGGLEFLTSTFGSGYGWRMASIDSSGVHLTFSTRQNSASWTESMRIDSSGNLLVGKTLDTLSTAGGYITRIGEAVFTVSANPVLYVNRLTDDGDLVRFFQATTQEGSISVSGTTVSYNGGHLSRWAQTTTAKDESLVKGTVLSNLDEMNVYTDAEGNPVDNEQLNKVKVSDVEGDVNVAGVFVNWTHDEDHNVDEINMAMTGDMIIRIAQGVTVSRGDLLMSAGDGTAKPQGDDIVRSKTIAKVTSTHVTCTYADGSFCVPCVLMAC